MINQSLSKEVVSGSISTFIDVMTKTYVAFRKQKMIHDHPTVFVQGQPGVGKSQAIYRIA